MRLMRLVLVILISTIVLCGLGAAVGGLTGLGMPGVIQEMSREVGYESSTRPISRDEAGERGAALGAAFGVMAGLGVGLVVGLMDQIVLLLRAQRRIDAEGTQTHRGANE